MNGRNVFWWLLFTVAAIWAQHLLPGIDFLVVGLVLSLQEGVRAQTLWLLPAWILIQEGTGSLAFGSAPLWYSAVFVFILVGRWLFEAENVAFVFLLALFLGGWHFALVQMMAALQDYAVAPTGLVRESVIQALVIPPAWYLARWFRRGWAC